MKENDIECMHPFCLTYYNKSIILDHLAFKHYEFVDNFEKFKSRFSFLGLYEEREINE